MNNSNLVKVLTTSMKTLPEEEALLIPNPVKITSSVSPVVKVLSPASFLLEFQSVIPCLKLVIPLSYH